MSNEEIEEIVESIGYKFRYSDDGNLWINYPGITPEEAGPGKMSGCRTREVYNINGLFFLCSDLFGVGPYLIESREQLINLLETTPDYE